MHLCRCSRRTFIAVAGLAAFAARTNAAPAEHRTFIAEAFRMRDEAVRAGDQAYGAVVVKNGRIIGFGPSRVISKKDWTAHAEREAIRDAQARLGRGDLAGCLLYASSRPCPACEAAAAQADIARMYYGSEATDGGTPQRL
jgi:tRNA(Arg) A34 adenosine deaminase TadA